MAESEDKDLKPGECISWNEERKELSEICGDEEIVKRVWKEIDSLGYLYIWHCLLSF